jgi:ATP-dependent DNA ligase
VAFQRKKPAAIGVKAPYPGFIEPKLATSVDKVPSGERWIHEIKFDGYRVQVHLRDAAVKVFTRRGNDWTNRFKRSPQTLGTSTRALRLLTGKWLSRPPMAPRIFRYSKTS